MSSAPPAEVAQATMAPPAPADQARPLWAPAKHAPIVIAVAVAFAISSVLAIMFAWDIWPFGSRAVRTENAYVRGHTTVISPQVSGYVEQVLVSDYQEVVAGQVLVRIDDRIYTARVAQARANLAFQIAQLDNSNQARRSRSASVHSQDAGLESATAQLVRARADMARADDLVRDGSISTRERDQTLAALRAAEAQVRQATAGRDIANEEVKTVDVSREGLVAQVDSARAQLRLAEIDLEHTVIRAPETGRLGEVGVRLGQYVTNGTQLLSLVPPDRWVIANFKEAQTRNIRIGQRATLYVDALGGSGVQGRVERLSPAAGQEFAVLKPDNATGNFVKVPQRIGVRISIDRASSDRLSLRPGMSVEAEVVTGDGAP